MVVMVPRVVLVVKAAVVLLLETRDQVENQVQVVPVVSQVM
jgi:hypothetical protein